MFIIGISAFYHDSAVSIIKNGEIIAAAQEERFTRIKNDSSFPKNALKFCINEAKISYEDISKIVFYEKPFLKFERLIETYLSFAPRGFTSFASSMPIWIKDKLFQKRILINFIKETLGNKIDWNKRILFSDHHLSHAASAFFPSPFERSAILTVDGVGEWTTTSVCLANQNKIKVLKEINFPHSLGLIYSAFTYYLGFKVNSGEYKVMGLAPYGDPKYYTLIKKNLIKIAHDGSFKLNMKYFNYATGLTMTNKKFHNLFGGPPRDPETLITQKDMNIASSIQKVTEEVILKIAKNIISETNETNLCLAGGVALNCVANGVLRRNRVFKNIWVQPASGDAGGSLGAALAVWYMHFSNKRKKTTDKDFMKGSFLGPKFHNKEISSNLIELGAKFYKLENEQLINEVADHLINQKVIGWVQDRMEFGPRSLGARSIIADPRSELMQKRLNLKIKFRESFRPFAPSILKEHLKDWYLEDFDNPYMLFVDYLKKNKQIHLTETEKNLFGIDKLNLKRSLVPAVTHVDYTSRIQTVKNDYNFLYYNLIKKFYEKTKCPLIVNTSFNIRGEPIVCNPKDAFKCFMSTDIDILVIGNYVLKKEKQDKKLKNNYVNKYELD